MKSNRKKRKCDHIEQMSLRRKYKRKESTAEILNKIEKKNATTNNDQFLNVVFVFVSLICCFVKNQEKKGHKIYWTFRNKKKKK